MSYNIKTVSVDASIAYEDNATTGSANIANNGFIVGMKVVVPALDGTDTVTVKIKDSDGDVWFSKASLAKSTTSVIVVDANDFPLRIPVAGITTVEVVTSGDQTADRAITVELFVQEKACNKWMSILTFPIRL